MAKVTIKATVQAMDTATATT